MRTLLTALTALMLFATPVVAWDWEDGVDAYKAGDYQKAFRLWEPLAKRGHAKAQSNLGVMYSNGKGVTKDDAKAVYWYRKAAQHGDAAAQYSLGSMYNEGKSVPEDDAKAVRWYRRAAEQGYEKAQHNLGWSYATGRGVPKNKVKAYAWWRISAKQGRKIAKRNKGIVEKKMTPAQIAEAQKLSSELWKRYVVPFQKD